MARDSVRLKETLRSFVLEQLVFKLKNDAIQVVACCLDGTHAHLLGRFGDDRVDYWLGRAKKHAAHALRQSGLRSEPGGIWAKQGHVAPIVDRTHRVRVVRYIVGHQQRGAAVYFSGSIETKTHG